MPTGLTRGAGWRIGVPRTVPHPPGRVGELLTSPDGIALRLGPA
ncbi:hypothetical protein [Kitasatospora paranensis]|uniref:Uncharacterized protein n=1 Tax=Kitasatospora paranensis TaxID=258053 RepID=A0ABW2G010_9ACTN